MIRNGHICGHGGWTIKFLLTVVIHQPFPPTHCHDSEPLTFVCGTLKPIFTFFGSHRVVIPSRRYHRLADH